MAYIRGRLTEGRLHPDTVHEVTTQGEVVLFQKVHLLLSLPHLTLGPVIQPSKLYSSRISTRVKPFPLSAISVLSAAAASSLPKKTMEPFDPQ